MEITYRTWGKHQLHEEAHAILTEFFRDIPLYSKMPLTVDLQQACFEILFQRGLQIDTWCAGCQKESTFTLRPLLDDATTSMLQGKLATSSGHNVKHELSTIDINTALHWLIYSCARSKYHQINFICNHSTKFEVDENSKLVATDITLEKIGQSPSPADMALAETRKYAKELSKDDFREFTRAIGLASHNVGIGSFVYLRRILERLIVKAAEENLEAETLEAFTKLRFRERIVALKDWLPAFLIENTYLYTILSKGIHELTEEECLAAFEPCKMGIELILDEHIAKTEKAQKIEAASRKLNELNAGLKDT